MVKMHCIRRLFGMLTCALAFFMLSGTILIYSDKDVRFQARSAFDVHILGVKRSLRRLRFTPVEDAFKQLDVARSTSVCPGLFKANPSAVSEAITRYTNYTQIPDHLFRRITRKCAIYKERRSYWTWEVSKEEETLPIAYSMLLYKDVEQAERLLRSIYRPHNAYCVHVDRKAHHDVHLGISAITRCFENVFVVPNPVQVTWGTITVLDADRLCMDLLLKKNIKWKYFINLTGQEYPLKTNYEIVNILTAYNGSNDIDFHYGKFNPLKTRTQYKCEDVGNSSKNYTHQKRPARLVPPPHHMKVAVGSTHIVASRKYIDYIVNNRTAIDFYEWVKDTCIPDETYYNSLFINPKLGVPGAYSGNPQIFDILNIHYTRYKDWNRKITPCRGMELRGVCIQNIYYLPVLENTPELFVNKFLLDYHPIALRCLEELMYNRTLQEVQGNPRHIDPTRYRKAHFVVNSVNKDPL